MDHKLSRISLATAFALGSSLPTHGVQLSANGSGQALIYPYYTVRTAAGGNALNTYISVVNTSTAAKAIRVRVREGRASRPVLDFNLYLSANDVWTAAVVPTSDGAQLLTVDTSCTDPAFATGSGVSSLAFRSTGYTGANADGFGDTLDRTREGYIEMIEMATLTGINAAMVTHRSSGVPADCAGIRATSAPSVLAPEGGLMGTLTLINVNSGQDFGLDATALDQLATRPYFSPASDPGPDFNSDAINPVSVIAEYGNVYRSVWGRPVDAVSAVLTRTSWLGEYVLDNATASLTEMVVTQPTKQHYVNATIALPPFSAPAAWRAECGNSGTGPGERISILYFNREEFGATVSGSDFPELPPSSPGTQLCAATGVASVRNPSAPHTPPQAEVTRTALFGSTTRGLGWGGDIPVTTGFQSGWTMTFPLGPISRPLVSLPASTRINITTGQSTAGPHTFVGLPVVGFMARTFTNGTLNCGAGSCQGNYGSAFPFKYRPGIAQP